MVGWRRLVLGGLACSVVAFLAGRALELWWLGGSEQAAFERIEREVRARFDEMSASLRATAGSLAARDDLIQGVTSDQDAVRSLFEIMRATVAEQGPPDLALTVYGRDAIALAWSGQPSEIPRERILGEPALLVAPGPFGPRLVHLEPVIDNSTAVTADGLPRRLGSVAAERVLSPTFGVGDPTLDSFLLPTSIASVSLRAHDEGMADTARPLSFLLLAPSGEPLLEARVARSDLEQARDAWRRLVLSVTLGVLALTVLLMAGPLLDRRAQARAPGQYLQALGALVTLVVVARVLLWFAMPPRATGPPAFSPAAYSSTAFGPVLRSPVDFLLTGLALAALVALAVHATDRWRLPARRRRRPWESGYRTLAPFAFHQLVAGAAVAGVLLTYEQIFLADTLTSSSLDVLHSPLDRLNSARLTLIIGLLFFHAATVWASIAILGGTLSVWRARRRHPAPTLLATAAWGLPLIIAIGATHVPPFPVLLVAAGCISAAFITRQHRAWYRHASQVSRLLAAFFALLIPALLLYPSLLHYADLAKDRLVEQEYAAQAANYPDELRSKLFQSLQEIDAAAALNDMVASLEASPSGPPQTDRAFSIWRQTALADSRLTSAVELYAADRSLVSRFALNVPEYAATTQTWQGAGCTWDVFGVAAPLGSQERQLLHAERGLCETARDGAVPASGEPRLMGAIAVQVMLDYEALPFISSESPYFEVLRTDPLPTQEGIRDKDVELVIYGWGLSPTFISGVGAWPIDEDLFTRLYASRQPFWTSRAKDDVTYHVYFVNNRAGIYALGYLVDGPFDHLVHLAEIATLVGGVFVLLALGSALFGRLARGRAPTGLNLLREIRSSFYRKLLLAFVAAAVVPVLALAFVIRTYFATQLRADVEAGAARTAAVAQRVIEESSGVQPAGDGSVIPISDDVMVWISQVIDQDVNIFDGPRLVATSERDLFASGVLPTRTPDDVYRAIVLQRLPSFVGEDSIGDFRYLVAAAPVRARGRDAILTVPLALRQQEIEQQINDLDRGIRLGAMLFILLGAGIGLSIAERIADPVKRLTRATRHIARGNFDARIAVRSADELQRLVEAFNRMAAELKDQRGKLERTHRLEAWAEMARQVAHEIKNPLTPVQLSAEHLLRVHADRGAPLTPVLQDCIESILRQVRLLRQIASEFSSFASSPAARPAPTSLHELVQDVLESYRVGLRDRIDLAVEVPPSLPPVSVDRTLIARALTNIIENALYAMPGRGSFALTASHLTEAGCVRLAISDTGIGLDEDALARIFEPYFSTKAAGTGLGMTIAKRNVELNGGTIDVQSERGHGTTVTLTLPVEGARHA